MLSEYYNIFSMFRQIFGSISHGNLSSRFNGSGSGELIITLTLGESKLVTP